MRESHSELFIMIFIHKNPQLYYQGRFCYDLLKTYHSSYNKKIIFELLKQLSATGSYSLKWVIWHAGLHVRFHSHRVGYHNFKDCLLKCHPCRSAVSTCTDCRFKLLKEKIQGWKSKSLSEEVNHYQKK